MKNRKPWLSRASAQASLFIILMYLGFITCLSTPFAGADGPDDNFPDKVRLVPAKGLDVSPEKMTSWKLESASINQELDSLGNLPSDDIAQVRGLLRAIQMTVDEAMFYSDNEIAFADQLLSIAKERLSKLKSGKRGLNLLLSDSAVKNGSRLVIGCFRSDIDGSYQPMGLVIPENWSPSPDKTIRLDVWLHGRDEKTSEVAFLQRRLNQPGEFTPQNAWVLHPYGRYSNAFKFAGEIDVLESLEFVKRLIDVDPNRISIRGFSMGGAGCWQMAVHYPDHWFAATPGAGFSETSEFLRIFQKEEFKPTWYQKDLLHWYDCPDWSGNLKYLNTIAYSGELDRQKQAADVMEQSLKARGISLQHVIGPQTEHKFHPDSKVIVTEQMERWADTGRIEYPETIDFTTYTLRYPKHSWVSIERLKKHWTESRILATREPKKLTLTTTNIQRLHIAIPVELFAPEAQQSLTIAIDDVTLSVDKTSQKVDSTNRTFWDITMERSENTWKLHTKSSSKELEKRPGLQGPIDDAFMSRLVFIPANDAQSGDIPADSATSHNSWLRAESQHALSQWKRHFRGDTPTENGQKISDLLRTTPPTQLKQKLLDLNLDCNWILFGSPSTNPVIANLVERLPIKWTAERIIVGKDEYPASNSALVMVYPNPYNPDRYIVLNSGFTFREYAYLNNARQIPMLPDWAIIDTTSPSNSQMPGKIRAAGFFNEQWQLAE